MWLKYHNEIFIAYQDVCKRGTIAMFSMSERPINDFSRSDLYIMKRPVYRRRHFIRAIALTTIIKSFSTTTLIMFKSNRPYLCFKIVGI